MNSSASSRVYLADDSGAIRSRVAALLDGYDLTVVGQGASPEACIAGILTSRPDVVVLDIQLEGGSGLQVLKAVRAADPAIAFVVFSNIANPTYRKRYLREGATAFLDKSSDFERLPAAIEAAALTGPSSKAPFPPRAGVHPPQPQ
jgi:DNA-binding NarL/FixJ family response regulator